MHRSGDTLSDATDHPNYPSHMVDYAIQLRREINEMSADS